MAHLAKKNGTFLVRFRYSGQEYKKSLKTTVEKNATAALRRVEDALHWLAINKLSVPPGVDPGDFIVSGGTLQEPRKRRPGVPTLEAAITEYQQHLGHLAETNRHTVGVHLNNFKKHLDGKLDKPLDRVTNGDLDAFLESRLASRSKATVQKERQTLLSFFRWAVSRTYLRESPAQALRPVKGGRARDKFRTVADVEAIIERGGLDESQAMAQWDCVFLSTQEIAGLLKLVRERMKHPVSFLLHAIPAYTGMRRGEVLRLRWSDVDFENDMIVARSRKQSRQEEEVQRRIDIHPELKAILLERFNKKGQFVVCDETTLLPLSPNTANSRFWQPLRGTSWCLVSNSDRFKIGFHTYRHSFASNLAAAGVDQRVIDEFMGHQTEAMRRRYRHLYPKARRSAIESFSLISGRKTRQQAGAS